MTVTISLEELEEARRDPKVQETLARADEMGRRMHTGLIKEVLEEFHLHEHMMPEALDALANEIYERDRKGPWKMPDMSDFRWEGSD